MGTVTAEKFDSPDLGRIYKEYGERIYRRALRILRNPHAAEDAAQEVFVRVMHTKSGYAGRGELAGWLYRITTHHCLNVLRNRRRRCRLLKLHVAPRMLYANVPGVVERLALEKLFSSADHRQVEAAVYVHLYGFSGEVAAAELGVSPRTLRNLLSRLKSFCAKKEFC